MSVILRLGAVNTDAPYSRLISDVREHEAPVDEDPYSSPPQTYPGCFGLPYQDHNYGAPPPPTPPQTPPLPLPPAKESLDFKEEIVVTSDTPTQLSPQNHLADESVDLDDPTRCICDFIHDDGYMIQCDKCSVWQHIVCMGLDRDSIPDTYECELCHPRPVDRIRAREFQLRKREFLKTLIIKSHDSSTDTDPEEVNNRLKAYGLDPADQNRQKQKMKLKKRKERMNSAKMNNRKKMEIKIEKENTSKEANKNKLLIKDFSSKVAKVKKEKLSKKIEKMRAERLSKEMKEDKMSSDDLKEDEKIINTLSTISAPLVQDENAQNPWDINTFNEWEQSYEVARYNQYTTYVQEYLTSACTNGHHNDIADLVTDGLRVQRCHIKELKCKKKGLEASCTIPEGQPVIEVIGKVMTRQQYDKDNFGQRQLSPFVFFYGKLFDLDIVVDASDYGNDARFIRRSCQPNAVVHHVVAGGQAHFIAVATKEVPENTEITIQFDYDYKKWNFCNECACLRNNCPVTRYQKKRLRFQKLQISPSSPKKFITQGKGLKAVIKSPVKSPTKSPIKTSPIKIEKEIVEVAPTPETIHIGKETTTPSPNKMVRRSQVSRQSSNNASTQVSSGRVRSLRVPSQVSSDNDSNVDPVTTPDPSNLRSLEADPLTSPETQTPCKDKEMSNDDLETPRQEKRKLTREERKMEAIMKAFEKMEKRNARKASVDQTKVKEKDKDEVPPKKDIKKEKAEVSVVHQPEVDKTTEEVKEEMPVISDSPVKKEVVVEKEEVPEVPVTMETGESSREEDNYKPILRERAPSKGKKAKKTASRRRTRNSSGTALSCEVKVEPVTEEVTITAPVTIATHIETCPVAPCVQTEDVSETPPSFRFLKTKRHLMNEWLHEKESDIKPSALKSEPLEVSIDEEMFVTCLPSPRNSMDRLRRNSQSGGVRDHHRTPTVVESSVGSAKKRWLRQAMGEGSESGMGSPGPASGGMSPNPQAMPSPGGSPPVDFVTPLKKRRLARESLSRESQSSEPPSSTPTPTSANPISGSGSFFAGLKETFELRAEELRNKNGFTSGAMSPLPASEVTCSASSDNSAISNNNLQDTPLSANNPCDSEVNASDSVTAMSKKRVEDSSSVSVHLSPPEEGDGVSSCADIDCNVSCNTGTEVVPSRSNSQISNNRLKGAEVGAGMDVSEQMLVCDAEQCANSEPDSSGSVCLPSHASRAAMEVECDSVSTESRPSVVTEERVEVDSTESRTVSLSSVLHTTNDTSDHVVTSDSVPSESEAKVEESKQCDSCNSERLSASASPVGRSAVSELSQTPTSSSSSSSSAAASVRTCTSSSGSSDIGGGRGDLFESSEYCISTGERASQVGSSTDPHTESRESVSESITVSDTVSNTEAEVPSPVAPESVSGSNMAVDSRSTDNGSSLISGSTVGLSPTVQNEMPGRASGSEPVSGSNSSRPVSESLPTTQESEVLALSHENEATINSTEDMVSTHISPTLHRSVNMRSLSTSSHVSSELSPVPNRHLKFLHDTPFGTDMTVDSTTHFMSNLGTSNSSAIQNLSYDSDSMDVTSATDASLNGGMEDGRKSEDSLTSFPESSSGDAGQPKEKKKVSLQEYLKRKKDKPTGGGSGSSTGGSSSKVSCVSSTVTTSPLKLTTPIINLDKLPPLPSLPSLPMFEKTERKEFKSSSEILSPIFNRKEKTEEVRKHMSLSERLRQEFGLDDSTDTDTDTEKTDQSSKGKEGLMETDVPPPPPPPPPQNQAPRTIKQIQNGSPIPSLLTIKTFPSSLVKQVDCSGTTASQMVPPPTQQTSKTTAGKKPMVSPINSSLSNLLASVRTPAQLQTDLTAQLAAIKAQISKVQQSLPTATSSAAGVQVSSQKISTPDHVAHPVNGVSTTGAGATQVFDYGHQSGNSNNFLRQNSYPGSASSSSSSSGHFHSFKKSSPSPGFNNKVSPRYTKVSPTLPGNQLYSSVNSNGSQSYLSNHQNSRSPSSSWNQKHGSNGSSASSSRTLFSKQPPKYSRSSEK